MTKDEEKPEPLEAFGKAGYIKATPEEEEFYGIDCDECGAPTGYVCRKSCPSYNHKGVL